MACIVDLRQHPAPSCAVLALRLRTEVIIAWGVAAELVIAALSATACWRTLCIEGVAIVAAVVLRERATVRSWIVGTRRRVAPRLTRTTFRRAFVINRVVISTAIVLRAWATVRSWVVSTQGAIASRLAWTALRLA